MKSWIEEIQTLAEIASTQPHAVYSALVHGVFSQWLFITRTIPDIEHLLQPLEDAIHQILIPALTGRPPCSKVERDVYALPSRLGGLGFPNPSSNSQSSFHASVTLTRPHVNLITAQNLKGSVSLEETLEARKNIRSSNRLRDICQANELNSVLSIDQKRQIALAKEKGASSWLTVTPIEEHGFFLNKGEFRDALHLRYGWDIRNTPQSCVCGSSFSINHAMTCKRGGFPILRHNEVRDMTAKLLSEVCHNVATEPHLQPLSGETFTHRSANVNAEARLDIKARGFWNSTQDAYFDVRVFTPLVFTTTGSMAPEASTFYKRLANLLSHKQEKPYSMVMGWLRCRLSFAILRSAIMCIRGTRSSFGRPVNKEDLTLASTEGQVPHENQ